MSCTLCVCALCVPLSSALNNVSLDFRNGDLIEDRRARFCAKAMAVTEGSVSLSDALRGENLHVVTALWDPKWFDEPVGNADPALQTGFNVRLFKLLAERAGFTYTIHSVPPSAFSPELSWNEYLDISLDKFDLNLDTWLVTEERAKLGMITPLSLWDMSLVSMVRAKLVKPGAWDKAMSFATPLSAELWFAFIIISILTSLFYSMFEKDHATDAWEKDAPHTSKVATSLWISFSSYTGARHYVPSTPAGKMLSLTYGFFILVLSSAYTANLAVFLVREQTVEMCASFDACVGTGQSVCIKKGTAVDTWLTRWYAHLDAVGRVVRTEGPAESSLIAGRCDVAVGNVVDYRFALQDHELNPHCSLHRTVEDPLQMLSGGWMIKSDYHETCSHVLRDSLSAHLLDLTDDGQVHKLMEDLYESEATQGLCGTAAGDSEREEIGLEGLPADSMLGAIAIHGLGFLAALALYACRAARHGREGHQLRLPTACAPWRAGALAGIAPPELPTLLDKSPRREHARPEAAAGPAGAGLSRDQVSALQRQARDLQEQLAALAPAPEERPWKRESSWNSGYMPDGYFPEGSPSRYGASPVLDHRRSFSASF